MVSSMRRPPSPVSSTSVPASGQLGAAQKLTVTPQLLSHVPCGLAASGKKGAPPVKAAAQQAHAQGYTGRPDRRGSR